MRADLSVPTGLNFLDPGELLRKARRARAGIPQARIFGPKYRPLLEQWCAAWFGIEYGRVVTPCKIAMNPKGDHEADFFLQRTDVRERIFPFQSVEVMEPGRKRGDEYRKRRPISVDFDRGKGEGTSWLDAGVQRKLRKSYAGAHELNVLVYLNFGAADFEYADVERALLPYRGQFASLWVMSHNVTASIFSTQDLGSVRGWTPRPGTPG